MTLDNTAIESVRKPASFGIAPKPVPRIFNFGSFRIRIIGSEVSYAKGDGPFTVITVDEAYALL